MSVATSDTAFSGSVRNRHRTFFVVLPQEPGIKEITMPPEFRFECKFCNKPIFVTYDLGGKQVRCPHCKNPVPVPVRDNPNADEKEEKEAKTSPKTKSSSTPQAAVKKKNPEKRPIHSKQNFGIGSIVKLVLLAAILFGGYKGYHYYRQQWQKDVPTLLKEYEEGKIIDAVGIKVDRKSVV